MKYFSILLFFISQLYANDYCEFNPEIKKIYDKIIQLDLKSAAIDLKNLKDYDHNLSVILLEDYIDFFQLFIYEKECDYNELVEHKSQRLQKISRSNISEDWALFLKSEILLHWSLIHLKRNETWQAFNCVNDAFKNLQKSSEKYPSFVYYKKSLGIIHTLLSTIPQEFDWAAKLVGLSGDLNQGKQELWQYIEYANKSNDIFKLEAKAAYAFVQSFIENQSKAASEYWRNEKEISGPLVSLISIKLYLRSAENKSSLLELNQLTEEQKTKLPYLYLLTGIIKLQNLNLSCEHDFIIFLKIYEGKNYIKECYQKLAFVSLLQGSDQKYKYYSNKCISEGVDITDEDQQALKEAEKKGLPDLLLLKARLLSDGANNSRAYHLLFDKLNEYYQGSLKLEYAYRMGRICQNSNKLKEALSFFKDAIEVDPSKTSHFSCSAMFYSGNIYENLGQKSEACRFYTKALEMKPDQYARSLHQKAKAGRARLNCIN